MYEDDAVIALDKPPGLLMHPSFHRNTGTLANYLAGYYQTTGQHSAVHPVSRLDRDTFGVVLLAKNAYIHALLCEAMRAGQLHKIYHALVLGGPDEQAGVIDKPIARLPKPSLLRCVRADGQRAITRYRVLAQHNGCSLLALEPVTGRTHQLRVHCADAGFPILGDPQYGTADSSAVSVRWGYTTQQLCACQLSFPHPMTGETVTLSTRRDITLDALKFSGISCQNRESDV